MSTKVNYQKIIDDLNLELKSRYNSTEILDDFPEFESEQSQEYFSLELDNFNGEVIYFQNMPIYSAKMNATLNHDANEVAIKTKEWFNIYLDSLNKLKF